MALNLTPEDLVKKLGLSTYEDGDQLISANKWENWNDKSGKDVQGFIKKRLADSVSSLEFIDQHLIAKNSMGDEVSKVKVEVVTPSFAREASIVGFKIDQNDCNSNSQYPYKDSAKYSVGVRLVIQMQTGSTTDIIREFNLNAGIAGTKLTMPVKVKSVASNAAEPYWVDITQLIIDKEVTPAVLSDLKIIISGDTTISADDITSTEVNIESEVYHLIKLGISCQDESLILANNTVNFKVIGTSSDTTYKLQYVAKTIQELDNVRSVTLATPVVITNGKASITLQNPGSYEILARAICDTNPDIVSDWIQLNVLAIGGYQGPPLAAVGNIATAIENCDSAQLFTALVHPSNGGSTQIESYLSDGVYDLFNNKFKTGSYSNLQQSDKDIEESFYSYNEFPQLSSSGATRILGLTVNIGNKDYKVKSLSYNPTTGAVLVNDYFIISISQHPYNKNGEFLCTENSPSDLNFNQVDLQNNNVFVPSNLDPDLGSMDGYTINTRNTSFKVSAQYRQEDNGLFRTPINLSNLLRATSGFSMEFNYKTSHVNGDDPVFSIGHLLFGPGYCRIDAGEADKQAKEGIWKNSKASFSKTEDTHVLVVFYKNYKPSTYDATYETLFGNDFSKGKSYDILKIYVNGTINREIEVSTAQLSTSSDSNNPEFNFQIKPISSDVEFYSIRTYQRPLSFAEVQKNRISAFASKVDKEAYYDRNNILDAEGKTISFYKAYKNYNVAVIVLPQGEQPLWYGNAKTDGSGDSAHKKTARTILIHHKDAFDQDSDFYKKYSGRYTKFEYKAQGSSAKKYMVAHNVQASKGTWDTLENLEKNKANELPEGKTLKDLQLKYVPLSDGTKPKKLVGKVNTASSMQSHKLGATRCFNDCWFEAIKGETYTPGVTGTRSAVFEEPFLYFYANVENPNEVYTCEDLISSSVINGTVQVDDSNVHFFGFLTWGSAKADKPVFGYGDDTPEYILVEGADNGSPGANFKQPWASFQCWNSQTGEDAEQQPRSVTLTDNFTGLLIKDETLKFESSGTDPWDFDFGCKAYKDAQGNETDYFYIPDAAKESFKNFVKFYNGCYEFDFTSYKLWTNNSFSEKGTDQKTTPEALYQDPRFKYYFQTTTDFNKVDGTTDKFATFDVVRYDAKRNIWVPAGLHYDASTKNWESYNLTEWYSYAQDRAGNDSTKGGLDLNISFGTSDGIKAYDIHSAAEVESIVIPAYKKMFEAVINKYVDVDNLAYHQAFCRIMSGTDNRAKNTYMMIFGARHTDKKLEVDGELRAYRKISYDNMPQGAKTSGYLKLDEDGNNDGFIYYSNAEKQPLDTIIQLNGVDSTLDKALKVDYKFQMKDQTNYKLKFYQDDVDTIFETDNNGQQLKPHYLLEPPFDKEDEEYWGDEHSSLFYPFDICFQDKVNTYTGTLLNFLVGSSTTLENKNSNFYKYFFYVQKYFPEIAYNHTAEIYYEMPQMFYNQQLRDNTVSKLSGFGNNNVSTPLSLSHGSCYESEVQFVTDRFKFLGGLTQTLPALRGQFPVNSAGSGSSGSEFKFEGNARFIDYAGPGAYIIPSGGIPIPKQLIQNTKEESLIKNYDLLIENLSSLGIPTILQGIVYPDSKINSDTSEIIKKYHFNSGAVNGLMGLNLADADLYKEIEITSGLEVTQTLLPFTNAAVVTLDGSSQNYNVTEAKIAISEIYPVVEKLTLKNVRFTGVNTSLDFRNCSRLQEIDLTGCTGIYSVIIPDNKQLTKLILPSSVEVLSLGNIPKLLVDNLKITGCKFKKLTLDINNIDIFNKILKDHLSLYAEILNITNQKGKYFYVPLDVLSCILSFKNINYVGDIYVGDDSRCVSNESLRSEITWKQKQQMAAIWGNIDNRSSDQLVKVYYKVKAVRTASIASSITVQNDGVPNYGINIKGNNIKILNNKLAFNFAKTGSQNSQQSLIQVESHNGTISINNAADGTEVNIQLVITLVDNSSVTAKSAIGNSYTTVIIGFYTPKLGDFAYPDGSFSPYYIPGEKPFGFVYYSKDNGSDVEVRVMSLTCSSTNQAFGPSILQMDQHNSDLTIYRNAVKDFVTKVYDKVNADSAQNILNGSNCGSHANYLNKSIVYTNTLKQPDTLTSGNISTNDIINKVNIFLSKLNEVDNSFIYSQVTDNNYEQVYATLNEYTNSELTSTAANYGVILYPAVQNAYRFDPVVTDEYFKTYKYDKGNGEINRWYIPSIEEVQWIVQNIVNSQVTSNLSNIYWGTTDWLASDRINDSNKNNVGFFYYMNQAMKDSGGLTQNKAAFVGSNQKITGESDTSSVYYYGNVSQWDTNATPQFYKSTYRSQQDYQKDWSGFKIVPCISINLSKN